MMSNDSIGTTTGVSVISSASLIKMLRTGVESRVRSWMLGEQDGVCGGVDVINTCAENLLKSI